jgi:uncharacterized protein YutE (UPF0331/DUF86 family)
MEQTLRQFEDNISRIEHLVKLYEDNSINNTQEDYSDILRAALVLLVSALDTFIHNIIRLGMVEILQGSRNKTKTYEKMSLPLYWISFDNQYEWFERFIHSFLYGDNKTSGKTYQDPDKIEEGINLILEIELWSKLQDKLNIDKNKLKSQLREIVRRRNQIAHESDLDSMGQKRSIEKDDILANIQFMKDLVNAIYNLLI